MALRAGDVRVGVFPVVEGRLRRLPAPRQHVLSVLRADGVEVGTDGSRLLREVLVAVVADFHGGDAGIRGFSFGSVAIDALQITVEVDLVGHGRERVGKVDAT
jgi:hypothetical protein